MHKNSNQVIPLKLRGKVVTICTKDNIEKNSKHFHGTSICAFQTMKPVDDGITRRSSQNDLVGTVSDFPLPQFSTNLSLLLKSARNIPEHYPL